MAQQHFLSFLAEGWRRGAGEAQARWCGGLR